jgi:F-type H+-transporting ATPase subunit epsilon
MQLEIISPEKIIYKGEVDSVTLPGVVGLFTILNHHAPIISVLKNGVVTYKVGNEEKNVEINSGFVEAKQNVVSVCIE